MSVQGLVVPLVPDIAGGVRCKLFPLSALQDLVEEGYGFDGFSTGFCGVEDSDLLALPDPRTRTDVDSHVLFICDIYKAGRRYELDTRHALEKVLERFSETGLEVVAGVELEFYVVKHSSELQVLDPWRYMEPLFTHDVFSLITDVMGVVDNSVGVEFTHHEVGTGQYELTLRRDSPVGLADRILLAKWSVKYRVSKRGLMATFMPKPFIDKPGSGMHLHLSLNRGGTNVTGPGGRREDGKKVLSEEGQSFLAGILEHAKALAALMASTVNSYKRLVPHFEAPIYICWGVGNRSAMVRVPEHTAARGRVRLEIRCPDPACNPYLALAGIITAGLRGLEEGLEAPEPLERSAYELREDELTALGIEELPGSLGEALEHARKDPVVREALGPSLARRFIELKEAEWKSYLRFLEESGEDGGGVTSWELNEYLARA